MLTQDWMMRQIETMTLAIAKLMFHKDSAEYEMRGGQDLLYSSLNTEDHAFLEAAVDFYFRLNLLSDQELEAGNFSRQEIEEGLRDVMDQYGVVLP